MLATVERVVFSRAIMQKIDYVMLFCGIYQQLLCIIMPASQNDAQCFRSFTLYFDNERLRDLKCIVIAL